MAASLTATAAGCGYSIESIARGSAGAARPTSHNLGNAIVLNYLLVPFVKQFGFLRIFNYISFRAAGAAVTALVVSFIVGPLIIRRLRGMRLHQVIREGTPESHQEKNRTPTMGGLIVLTGT